ncbi:hypothetical protein APHAL10511_006380 [Amanita phalloides]|nr:hypothetical protein APHAL10511_006380 [Amanita phalloides]
MWWLDPGKDVLQILFNRILAPYVENLDLNQVNYGIGQGQLTLRNLRLKKEALDKFQLPVDVAEGRLGKFTLSLHWMNLGNRPVEIQIEDVFLLVIPSPLTNLDSAEEEARMQAAKLERLENAELLQTRGEAVTSSGENCVYLGCTRAYCDADEMKSQGLWQSLITKVINNIQITIKNIHIRYEDNISVPGHPFAAGLTLAEFTAVSVNDQWKQAFIESTAGSIHKLATLSSLALYFDTDATRVTELTPAESAQILSTMIVRGMGGKVDHQFILKPVSGEGRITINHKVDPNMPRYDVQLLFDEIGFALDEDQYRDVISLADMYHIYLRRRQYRRYRCSEDEYARNPAQERLRFAMTTVLEGIREKRRKWSWPYFAERRDDRNNYVSLFQRKLIGSLEENALEIFEALERKLSYEDLRFYRSIARSRLRKDEALRKRLETEREERESKQTTWASWFWGPTTPSAPSDATFRTPITNEQRKQLYEVLDYDEKTALADSLQAPQDSLKALVSTQLRRGSVSLISDPHGKASEIMSVIFDFFQAKFTQRPDNFEVSMLLGSLSVYDGTKGDSLYPQIVRVKSNASHEMEASLSTLSQNDAGADPRAFFYLNYENNPLDKRADNALTVRLRHMEIIYHKGYVEAIYKFFEPPASQLESVEALLDVASQTLEGIRKETRAVLEYSLQAHKTIDVQMDLNAPLIIIPEDVTTYSCKHLIIDAGHIAVESKLADKNEIRAIEQKRQQVYSEDDYKNLESLMYDRFMLRLEAAQFVIGDNLQSCRDALASGSADTLHILERTNIDLQVQISIVPNVSNLARFKISGILPHLRINFSDSKYKAMMRIVDVCIPKFDGEVRRDASEVPNYTGAFPAPSIFRHPDLEYHSDDGVGDEQNMARDAKAMNKWPDLRQTVVEIDFCADTLSAALAKTDSSALEVPLGDVTLKQFALKFSATRYDMKADLKLRSLCMTLFQPGRNAIDFVSSPESDTTSDANLLHVKYTRIEKKSPDFLTISGGFEQEVDVRLSTFIFQASPEPLIAVYDLIMSAFVSREMQTVASKDTGDHEAKGLASVEEVSSGRIRVKVNLASVQLSFIDGSSSLATLSLSTANISVILEADAMQVSGRLGNLKVTNDDRSVNLRPEFQEILSIEGQDFADFSYEKNDSTSDPQQAVESYMTLNAASIRLNFVERPLHGLYVFFLRFAKLKGLYDAATQVAVQKAPAMERMKFEVCIKSPIIVFPSDPVRSPDILVLLLGEVGASNTIEDATNNIKASLSGIQLVSETRSDSDISTLKIVDKIDISSSIVQFGLANDGDDAERPDTKVTVKISDVKLHLTQSQYCLLVDLAKSIPRIFSYAVDTPVERQATRENVIVESSSVSLEPELKVAPGQRTWTTLDLVVTMNTARLHLYDAHASSERTLKEHGVARFALHDNTLRLKVLSNGSFEAQVTLQSFTMSNTGPGNSRFREIIPAATHSRNQFTVLYTASGDDNRASLAILTIETPRIIFAVDPVIALLEFFTSPFQDMTSMGQNHPDSENNASRVNGGTIEYRIDLHDASISVLENDADPESQAIELTISQVLLSQQGILALRVDSLGMSLTRMGRPSEKVKFMDDVDFTLSLDSRSSVSHQLTSVEIFSKTVIFRASYRDIALITSIFNRALESYDSSQRSGRTERDATTQSPPEQRPRTSSLVPAGRTHVTMIKEQLKCSIDGFSLILIGDLHEQPLLHLVVKPFILGGQDWSGELRATTTIASHINYWNLTNSHWEPLMDPWTLTLSISKDGASGCMNYSLISQERLDLNLTVAFIDLVVTAMKVWNKDAYFLQKARGEYAPYRICNRTGCALTVWSESSGTSETQDIRAVKVAADEAIDWRFDDWRTTREHVSSFIQHNIGLSFDGKPWGQLHHMPVNQEGEYTFLLRPQTSTQPKRLLCEIKVVDSVKLVTLRSTYKIENSTLYPLELMLVNEQGEPIHSVERLAPGDSYPIPIDIVTQCRIRLQPDQGFGYRWSQAIRWEDVIAKKNFTVACYHADSKEAPFHVQASVQTNGPGVTQRCTKVNLRLCAPLEVENLLPYNLDYRIYDRDTEQTWMSYLRKGGAMPVHSVEVGHLLLLNVVVQDTVFKPSEFTIINPGDSEYDVENRLLLQDTLGRQLRLKLNYVRHPDSGGAFKVQIYSPYIVMNKTGVPFRIRSLRSTRAGYQDAAGEHRTEYLSNPTPFLLSHLSDDGHEFVMMIGESTWSKLISLDAPSAEVEVAAPSNKRKSECIYTGLSWTEGRGKYQLTKVITLSPRFLLKNNLSEAITFREHGGMPRDNSILEPGTRTALRVFRADNEKLLTFACPGLDAQWSPPINIADIGVVHFRLRSQGTSAVRLIRTDVQLNGATIFVSISYSENQWPFKIENNTDHIIKIRQTSGSEEMHKDTDPVYAIQPMSTLQYAWDYPAAKGKKILISINGHRRAVDLHEIGDLMPFTFYDNRRPKVVALDTKADGYVQVLRITPYSPEHSKYKPRPRSNSAFSTRTESISSSTDIFEAVPEQLSPTVTYAIDFAGIGISVIDKKLVEVLYVTMGDLKFEYAFSPVAQAINISCGTLQVDNQLHDALFPVVLQPTPIPSRSSGIAPLPTIQASIIWLNDNEHGVLFVRYCSVLLQALTIEVDEDLLFSLYELTQIEGIWEHNAEDMLMDQANDLSEPPHTAAGQNVYFEILEFQPIMLSLSFMRTERVNSDKQLSDHNPLAFALNALTMTIGNVNDAPVMMNALAFKDMRLTMPELQKRVLYHYRQDILRQLYRILGSADFIGNPVGLFNTVSSGVADIFYEPFHGVVMRGNKEFGIGLAKGAASFVKKTVFGLTDSVTKFTSSVGKGLSAATFDSEYQAKRRLNQRRNRPRHAIYGVTAGGEALASSVTSAVEGILMKPIEGAETEGAVGFFKGIGKGLIGAVTKPVVGVFDLASNVSEGIRNTTTVFDNPEKDRVRMPRLIPADNVLRSYSPREALGQFWMKDLKEGAYRREHYVAHIQSPGGGNIVLLTTMRVLSFWPKRLQAIWELPFAEVQGVTVEDTGIRFAHKSGKEHDKFVHIPDKKSQTWFFGEIASVVKSFNARRRIES